MHTARKFSGVAGLLFVSVLLIAVHASAFWSSKKSPEEKTAESKKKAVEVYNNGVKHMDKARAILRAGDSTYAYNYRATSDAKARKEYQKAANDFERAVKLDSTFFEAYNNLGYCYRKLGDFPAALGAYDRAISLNTNFAQAREYRGQTYLAMGKLDLARNELEFLRDLESPYADSLSRSIQLYQLDQLQNSKVDSGRVKE
jgi:tetratricopeptide (TPR) repeat protein